MCEGIDFYDHISFTEDIKKYYERDIEDYISYDDTLPEQTT